ncbi:MAG: DinB family protein [Bacteroidetes bacterium]|nr:DinB family protein [Bacteroidota bacterium]MDA0860208.1 DinB family protein [Bacteroidota bacterium]MDA1319060.1 DinB family protein [Bacteroidota bacterium]
MNWSFDITLKTRAILYKFLEQFSLEQLNTVPKGYRNSIYWNIMHVVVTQQLLVYGLSGLPMLIDSQLIEAFRKGTKTEEDASQKDVDLLKGLLTSTIEQTQRDYAAGIFTNYTTYTVSTKSTLTNVEEALEFNNFHEGIHLGYILAMKNTIISQ